MKDGESAFPVFDSIHEGENVDYACVDHGMTLPQYAAIHLRVPCSGDPELDSAIRQSRRAEFAKAVIDMFFDRPTTNKEHMAADVRNCFAFADVMLAEWEKG
jgi:hypothetical protein